MRMTEQELAVASSRPTARGPSCAGARWNGALWGTVSWRTADVDLNDPSTVALLAADGFETAGHRYALYGVLLTAVYGEPCETRDADWPSWTSPWQRRGTP
jgi:hypothetical protein